MTSGTDELTRAAAAEVVATVDGRPVTAHHVARRLATIRAGAPDGALPAAHSPEDRRLRRWVVQILVDELLVEQEARRAGIRIAHRPGEPLDDATVAAVFERVTAGVAVADAEVARYYAANRRRYRTPETRTVHQAVVGDAATARRVTGRARVHGLETAARSVAGADAETTEMRRGAVGGRLEAVVFAAGVGAVPDPVPSPAGWHVVEVVAARPETVHPLDVVAGAIRDDLLAAARGSAFDGWLAAARRHTVRLMPGHEHPGDPRVPDAVHRH